MTTHVELIEVADIAQYDPCLQDESSAKKDSSTISINDHLLGEEEESKVDTGYRELGKSRDGS